MPVKIRLQRHGAKKSPFYRLVVADSRQKRDGRFVEVLGTYNPKSKRPEEELRLKLDRADYWLGVGAQPSDTVRSLINRARRSSPTAPALEPTESPAASEPDAAPEAAVAEPTPEPGTTVETPEETPEEATVEPAAPDSNADQPAPQPESGEASPQEDEADRKEQP